MARDQYPSRDADARGNNRAATYAGAVHHKRAADPNAKRPKVKNKRMDELIRKCWEQGWWCERGGKNHVKCYPPNDQGMVPVPSTPSGSRTYANKLAALKRRGLRA